MKNYYFKLVCIDDQDPLEYNVLFDINLGNLDDVHTFVVRNINKNMGKRPKWILIPLLKEEITIS